MHNTPVFWLALLPQALVALQVMLLLVAIMLWFRNRSIPGSKISYEPGISIIVPARNEAENIVQILHDLSSLRYPKFEIIVVDDASEDKTAELVEGFCRDSGLNINLLRQIQPLPGLSPKKSAMCRGAEAAKYDWIATTDADCRIGQGWLAGHSAQIEDNTNMICGPVLIYNPRTLIGWWEYFEMAALMFFSALSMRIGKPTMINAANMVVRKEKYLELGYGEYGSHASGDDIFLMETIFRYDRKSVLYNLDAGSVVYTKPQTTWNDLLEQRKRWVSKWRDYRLPYSGLLARFVGIFNINRLVLLGLGFWGFIDPLSFVVLFYIPSFLEWIMVRELLRLYGQPPHPLRFLLLNTFYPIYAVMMGIKSMNKRFSWKGRGEGHGELAGNT